MPTAEPKLPSTGPESPSETAIRSLVRIFGLLRRAQQPYFARFGISLSQWGVLHVLQCAQAEGEKGLRLTDLGDRLLIRPPSVTGVVDRLQRQGLVARSASSDDQRARCVSLTAAGRQLVDRVEEGHMARLKLVLEVLSVGEQKELRRLLDRLGMHLESIVEQEGGGGAGGAGGAGGNGAAARANHREQPNGPRRRGV